ncbi:MAG: hypothetical protein COV66_11070 [Nitrospinae bacterium CG11_big_fil_rev_8_21_14_0_20_45_15]|nr:MAG: hypothetical protein COV66_11070 [Nitrospinae bacterium CG11_big_fil_rev_8_21_14_0_20_45_15]
MKNIPVKFAICETPLGLTGLATSPKGLCNIKLNISCVDEFEDSLNNLHHSTPQLDPSTLLPVLRQFDDYFAGKLKKFDCPLDISQGLPFQRSVWSALLKVPYGETRSYQWLADAIGNPKACRAVGTANGKNNLPIVIPCHRIIRKNGDLGGFTGGLHLKSFLLDLEKTVHGTS